MFGPFTDHEHVPCEECGESVARAEWDAHLCDYERALTFRLFHLRDELGALEAEFAAFMTTPAGRFEAWYAERERLRAA